VTGRARSIVAGAVASALLVAPRSARAGDDPWFGRDKALHASVSAAIAGATYAVSAPLFDARYPPLLLGAGVSIAAGAVKELHDLAGYGDPSWKDFTWDVIGTAGGLAIAWGIDLLVRGVSSRHPLVSAPEPASGAAATQPSVGPVRGGIGPAVTWRW